MPTKEEKMMGDSKPFVLVTTAHRGVFTGVLESEDDEKKIAVLSGCRNVIYWSGERGFLSIAATGPAKESKLGALAQGPVKLRDITSVTHCSEQAEKVIREWS